MIRVRYVCELCGWIYNESTGCPEIGAEPGTVFDDLPDDFVCPQCAGNKEAFSAIEEKYPEL